MYLLLPTLANAPTIPTGNELCLISGDSVKADSTPLLSDKIASLTSFTALSDINPVENKYQAFLREELLRIGKTEKDFLKLKEVYFCESNWQQYDKSGKVLISKGNVGISQINISAHYKTYTEMGLDIYEPYDNLRFGAFLYARDGLNPWLSYSGHCFLPRIRNL